VNTSLNELRRRKREGAAFGRVGGDVTDDPSSRSDTQQVVGEAIDKLPDRLRVAVICRYFLDLSEAEMARVLKVRPGTVKSRLHEARQVLAGDSALVAATTNG
jgi:RNA polymerase sigma factor (sigma-70 family)